MGAVAGRAIDLTNIKEVGRRLELTDQEVAAVVGVHPTTLWRWREERVTPRGSVRSRIAQLEELLGLLRQVFDGPDIARHWVRSAHPEMLGGEQTPLEAMMAGRTDKVLTVLQFLARGA